MSDEGYQDRTEEPTPKRQSEAREKGQVARSRELSAALVLITGVGMLSMCASSMGTQSAAIVRSSLEGLRPGVVTSAHLQPLLQNYGLAVGQLLAPLWLMLGITAILANFLQGGWIFSTTRVTPDLSRLQLLGGIKRLFSGNSLLELAKNLAKVSFIGLVVYFFIKNRLPDLFPLVHEDTGQLLSYLRVHLVSTI